MKKIGILLFVVMMLVGCTKTKEETTFMITKDNQLYALYNQDGKKLTEYSYKTFEEVNGIGYIVTDAKDQKGFISLEGEEVIAFGTYATIEAVDKMLYTTKKVEPVKTKEDDKDKDKDKKEKVQAVNYNNHQYTNLYVLNGKGEVLYTASKDLGIKKSGLPIIYDTKTKEYTVLYQDGKELLKDKNAVVYANQKGNSTSVVVGFKDFEKFYYFDNEDEKKNIELTFKEKGTFQILAQNEKGVVLNDATLKSMIYVDLEKSVYYQNNVGITAARFDETQNIILTAPGKLYVYPVSKIPVLMNSYYVSAATYAQRSNVVYGPHNLYKNGKTTGDLENCQLYPDAYHILSEIFPVYQKNKGFEYYNFDNKKVFEGTYLEAEPFDENLRAIVKVKEDGYSLIDDKGTIVTEKNYSQIKYIGSSYYAVYNKNGLYGIINIEGKEVLPLEYTSLPEKPVFTYDDIDYMILNKNGRSYVYEVEDDMNAVFSQEGNVVFHEQGYYSVGNQYYTFEGELME